MGRKIPVLGLIVLALAAAASGQTGDAKPKAGALSIGPPSAAAPPGPVIPDLTLALKADAPQPLLGEAAPKETAAPAKEAPAPAAEAYKPGGCHVLVTGDTVFTYTARRHGRTIFMGELNPLFLIQFNDRLLMELAIETNIANGAQGGEPDRNMTLAHANLSYIVSDRLTVGAGLFHIPFGAHMQHFAQAWINEFPDEPLPFGDRSLVSEVALGGFATGAAPVGSEGEINYSLFIGDGGTLITDDPDAAGDIMFDRFHNFEYTSRNQGIRTIGGRIGYLPAAGLEFGTSFQGAQVNPEGFRATHQFQFGVDANYYRSFEELQGEIRARAEWIWQKTQERTFDPDGSLGFGPLRFNNSRDGGYCQVGYRPTLSNCKVLQNTEFAFRYDRLNVTSDAPNGGKENRWTPCILYWFTPSAVAKLAYEYDKVHGMPADHFLIFQFAVGF